MACVAACDRRSLQILQITMSNSYHAARSGFPDGWQLECSEKPLREWLHVRRKGRDSVLVQRQDLDRVRIPTPLSAEVVKGEGRLEVGADRNKPKAAIDRPDSPKEVGDGGAAAIPFP